MGMAASQARLLSITSRMSDNELRSQLINNQKIRLATESAKASERYVAALNDTSYMMSCYDIKGNPVNEALTFASLTAYSSYNNQYGLRNLSGQPLVSEETAYNFEKAIEAGGANGTALEEFLRLYNLEKSTTFFDGFTTEQITGALGINAADLVGTDYEGINGATLKDMYFGVADKFTGYDQILGSNDYKDYEKYFTDFNNAYDSYVDAMYIYMDKYNREDLNGNGLNLSKLKSDIEAVNPNDATSRTTLTGYYNDFLAKVRTGSTLAVDTNQADTFFNDTCIYQTENLRDDIKTCDTVRDASTGQITVEGIFTITPIAGATAAPTFTVAGITVTDDEGTSATPDVRYTGEDNEQYIVTHYNEDKESVYYIPKNEGNATTKGSTDNSTYKENLLALINIYLEQSLNYYDPTNTTLKNLAVLDSDAKAAYDIYTKAGAALSNFMYGYDVGEGNYAELNDLATIFGNFNNLQEPFQNVLDVLILERIFNEYGDPNVTWIDMANPNENADAKAQWYTNLFNSMCTTEITEDVQENAQGANTTYNTTYKTTYKASYQVLEDGLATSSDWIRFALENGLVTMTQVDLNNDWCSTIYSNCADITETTNDTEATIAEAEYNATMAKIEAKDKQLDIQLKNIDTEHNSLQTEYDSIKTVLDKNIERNFKMYSA